MNGHDDIRGGLNAAVAATLNGERTAANLTIEDLAARSGVNGRTLKRLLKSQRDIDVNVMAQIGAVFNLTPAEVVAKAEDWQRRNQSGQEVEETARRIAAEARAIRDSARDQEATAAEKGATLRRRGRGGA